MKALITNMNFGSTRKNKKAITKLFETIVVNVTTLFSFSSFKR